MIQNIITKEKDRKKNAHRLSLSKKIIIINIEIIKIPYEMGSGVPVSLMFFSISSPNFGYICTR
jgi:hypothetical protein